MPTAIGYIRASTVEQTQTLAAQRARIEAWAEREGYELRGVYVDAGVSGTTPPHKRVGLSDALVVMDDADVLAVTTRDRLARSALDAALFDWDLAGMGARVVAVDGDAASNADTDEGRLVRGILDAVAEYEAARTRAQTRAVLRHRRQHGLRTGGRLPYGFGDDAGRLVPVEAEQDALRRLYTLADAGSSQRVARSGRSLPPSQLSNGPPAGTGSIAQPCADYLPAVLRTLCTRPERPLENVLGAANPLGAGEQASLPGPSRLAPQQLIATLASKALFNLRGRNTLESPTVGS